MRQILPHFKFIEHSSSLLKKSWSVCTIAAETKVKVEAIKERINKNGHNSARYDSYEKHNIHSVRQINQSFLALRNANQKEISKSNSRVEKARAIISVGRTAFSHGKLSPLRH